MLPLGSKLIMPPSCGNSGVSHASSSDHKSGLHASDTSASARHASLVIRKAAAVSRLGAASTWKVSCSRRDRRPTSATKLASQKSLTKSMRPWGLSSLRRPSYGGKCCSAARWFRISAMPRRYVRHSLCKWSSCASSPSASSSSSAASLGDRKYAVANVRAGPSDAQLEHLDERSYLGGKAEGIRCNSSRDYAQGRKWVGNVPQDLAECGHVEEDIN